MKIFIEKFKRILSTQRGFNLPEMLIGVSLLGGSSLAFMKLQENMTKSQITSEAKMSELEIKRMITTNFLDKTACYMTFVAMNIGADIQEIKNSSGGILYESQKTYENNSLKISRMRTVDKNIVNADGTRMIDLVISLERVKKQAFGGDKEMRIPLSVKASGANDPIQECYSNTDAIILSAMEESCLSFKGTWNSTTKKCQFSKLELTGEIKIGNSSLSCDSTNEGLQRYNSGLKKMEFCNGMSWISMSGVSL